MKNIDDKIENFNVQKNKDELDNIINKINEFKHKSINIQNIQIKIDFKLDNFTIMKNYDEILMSKKEKILIYQPLFMKIQLMEDEGKEEKNALKIIIPNKTKNNSSFFVFALLKFNNKIYHFQLLDNENNNENENIKISNDEFDKEDDRKFYITFIPKNELNEKNNNFYFYYYSFSIN